MPTNPPPVFPAAWRPAHLSRLVRVGPQSDGGYVISAAALERTKRLVSGGVFDDWRFEADFQARTGCEVDCYDPTISAKFWAKRYHYYLQAMPSGRTQPRDLLRYFEFRRFFKQPHTRLHSEFISYPNWATDLRTAIGDDHSATTFLKIDIEGSEYRVIDDIIARQDAIAGFVIEFHDVDLHVERISRFIANAAPWFRVEHLHVNNYPPTTPAGFPTAIEISFGRTDGPATQHPADDQRYPIEGLDFPSNPEMADIAFTFA